MKIMFNNFIVQFHYISYSLFLMNKDSEKNILYEIECYFLVSFYNKKF